MARVTLGDRLEVLASSPHLPEGRRQFAASLLAHYQKRRSLTKGRRVWVDRLEAMVEEAKNRDPSEYESLVADIEDVMTRVESDEWSADFLASIRDQAKRVGARLSRRQQEIFEQIKSQNTPELVERRKRWAHEYQTHHLETAAVLASYYLTTGYWLDMANSIIDGGFEDDQAFSRCFSLRRRLDRWNFRPVSDSPGPKVFPCTLYSEHACY